MAKKASNISALSDNHYLYTSVGLFKVRLEKAMNGRSNRAVAQAVEMSEGALREYLRGGSVPDLDRMARLAHELKVRLAWLATGELPMHDGQPAPGSGNDEFAYINNLRIEASAGDGFEADTEAVNNRMAFRKDWLKQHGLMPEKLCFISARGDSMEPLIRSGDTLLVNVYFHTEGHELVHGLGPGKRSGKEGIFVLRMDGGLVIKRLQPDLEGGYHIRSDNHEYEPLYKKAEDLVIVGRVEWIGRRL